MSLRIVHVSDIHFDEREERVKEPLQRAISLTRPNFIVCTGDLVSQPVKRNFVDAKAWLDELAGQCGLPQEKVIVIPGNHDNGFWGSFGVSYITGFFFRSVFRENWLRRVASFENDGIIFIPIDSNPTVLELANGRVSEFQINRLRKELAEIESDVRRKAAKIALIHHHCLPVYNESSGDRYLLLKNSQPVIEFFADQGIDLVLHGHKHRATHSILSIGGVNVENRVIEVLAAGTAMKRRDCEERGHNFNLISIEASGVRSVSQFFSKPVGAPFVPSRRSQNRGRIFFDQIHQGNRFDQPFTVKRVHWDLLVTLEGDRLNEMTYTGFRASPDDERQEYVPPSYSVDRGSISEPRLVRERTSDGIRLEVVRPTAAQSLQFKVLFDDTPRGDGVNFLVRSWDFNACSLSESEFRVKYPGVVEAREWEEKEIDVAMENFSWHLSFPEKFGVRDIRFDVYDRKGEVKKEEQTASFQSGFVFSRISNSACLNIQNPSPGYRYRISWRIPHDHDNPLAGFIGNEEIPPQAQADLPKFVDYMMSLRKENETTPSQSDRMLRALAILLNFQELVVKKIAEVSGLNPSDVNVTTSFMVFYEGRLVPTVLAGENLAWWSFTLAYGDGNAGRAYKQNITRIWPAWQAVGESEPPDWYIPGPGPKHHFICSIPLRHPESKQAIVGILNIGSFDRATATACRWLSADEGAAWLIDYANKGVLTRLLEEAKL